MGFTQAFSTSNDVLHCFFSANDRPSGFSLSHLSRFGHIVLTGLSFFVPVTNLSPSCVVAPPLLQGPFNFFPSKYLVGEMAHPFPLPSFCPSSFLDPHFPRVVTAFLAEVAFSLVFSDK